MLTSLTLALALAAPTDLPGLVLWLDASDAATVRVEGRGVTAWRDKSPKAASFTQPADARRPTWGQAKQNGLPLVGFDGGSFIAGPGVLPAGAPAYTLVAVWRPHHAGGVQAVLEQSNRQMQRGARASLLAVGGKYGFNGEADDAHDLVEFAPNEWRLSCLSVDKTAPKTVTLLDNGVPTAVAVPAPRALSVGGEATMLGRKVALDAEYLDGEIAEVLAFDRVLTADEARELTLYLDVKWGTGVLGWFRTPDGKVLALDFEHAGWGPWRAEGTAFGDGPARDSLPGQMKVAGWLGRGYANSFHGGDGATGRLTSPPLLVERDYLRFLIGGGKGAKTALNLLVDGKVERSASGPNEQPGGSEQLGWVQWDVSELKGKTAVLQLVDAATGAWGHLTVDHIMQTDAKLQAMVDLNREIVADDAWLNLPVKNGAPRRRMRLKVDGQTVREFDIDLADHEPDWLAPVDLAPFRGKTLRIEVDKVPEDSMGLNMIDTSDTPKTDVPFYTEKLRPQFHFSPRRGWTNDPNGLVYYAGEYHLYFQHNPYGWAWGNMHWGHAVSSDLLHWQELPIAIYPPRHGDDVFSGSATVDYANTGGFKTGDHDPIVAAFTSTGRGEVIVYSNDRGRTFKEIPGNPVVKHGGRDPKLVWYAPGKHWVMAVYDEKGKERAIAFYTSPDLKQWTYASKIDGYFECPELFEIALDGDPANTRWVVYAANGEYQVGRFDGRVFTPETPHKVKYNWGNCFYASQTYNNLPAADGRRIQIAWGQMATPGMPFNQLMDFPVELTLHTTPAGPRLFAVPVREVAKLHDQHWSATGELKPGENPLSAVKAELLHAKGTFTLGAAKSLTLTLRGHALVYDAVKQTLTCGGHTAPLPLVDGKLSLEVLVDRTTVEIYGNHGQVYMPLGALSRESELGAAVTADGAGARVDGLDLWSVKSVWGK